MTPAYTARTATLAPKDPNNQHKSRAIDDSGIQPIALPQTSVPPINTPRGSRKGSIPAPALTGFAANETIVATAQTKTPATHTPKTIADHFVGNVDFADSV